MIRFQIFFFWRGGGGGGGGCRKRRVAWNGLMRLHWRNAFPIIAYDGRSISRNVAILNTVVHNVINLLYYIMNTEQTDKNIFMYIKIYVCIYKDRLLKIWTNGTKNQYLVNRKWTKKKKWYSVRNIALIYVPDGFLLKYFCCFS